MTWTSDQGVSADNDGGPFGAPRSRSEPFTADYLDPVTRILLTTSWDDGDSLDMRLAEKLAARGLRGTFYWVSDSDRWPLLPRSAAEELMAMGMEIGAHTKTHPDLRRLSHRELTAEVTECRDRLEDHLGVAVTSFCYPFGYHNREVVEAARSAGYDLARTTVAFSLGLPRDRMRMATTFQLFPHPRPIHLRHAMREGNFGGVARWATGLGLATDPVRLAQRAKTEARRAGGVIHVWGHSWEIEEHRLWGLFDEVFDVLADGDDYVPVTNRETLASA